MALSQVLTLGLALTSLVLVLTWTLYFDEGFSLSQSHVGALFNLHPALMTFAYAVCMPIAALQYRHPLLKATRHAVKKAYHASFHLLALAALVLGLAAVIASKLLSVPARGHMYTLHSYIGAATIGLSVAQFALALGYFGLSARAKQALSKFHRPLGFAITVAGLSTILSGFNEVQVLHMRPGDPHYSGNVVIVSAIGLTVLALLVAVVAALSDSSPGQEGRAQFATVEKADVHASVPRMAV